MEIEMLDAPEVREEPTAIQQTSIALVQGALVEFDKVAAGLADLKARFGNVIYDVGTTAGMAAAKAARLEIRGPRYAVDKVLKATKDPLNQIKKELDDRAGQITAALLEIETPIHEQIKTEEDRKAAEKAERDRIAAEQKLVVDNAITWIRNHAIQAVGKSAAEIAELVTSLETMEVTLETFSDRAGEAEQCRLMTLDVLNGLHAAVTAQEEAAAKVEAERIRLERERLAQAAAAKEAAAKAAAEADAARAKADEEAATAKAALDAERAELAAERERVQRLAHDAALISQVNAQVVAATAKLADAAAAEQAAERAAFEAEKADAEPAAETPPPCFVPIEPASGIGEIMAAAADAGDVEYIALEGPSDADIIFCAARAVAIEYGMTVDEAVTRLANVCGWKVEGVTA